MPHSFRLLLAVLLAAPQLALAASTSPGFPPPTATPTAGTSPAPATQTAPATASKPTPLQTALFDLFSSAGMKPTTVTLQDNHCTIAATTTTARLARALKVLESSNLPLRQDAISIRSTDPGADNLRVEMRFTLDTPKTASIPAMDVLQDLTALFLEKFPVANTVWLTSLSCDNTIHTWQIEGQSISERYAVELAVAVQTSPRFQTRSRIITPDPDHPGQFTCQITFLYKPAATATSPSAPPSASTAPQ